jgi:hypothetical protein
MLEPTPQQMYNAAMDSVNLINQGKPEGMSDADWQDTVARNKEHLEIQIAKGADFYGDLDLTPLQQAVF